MYFIVAPPARKVGAQEEVSASPANQELLLTRIRDLLKNLCLYTLNLLVKRIDKVLSVKVFILQIGIYITHLREYEQVHTDIGTCRLYYIRDLMSVHLF
jgi:hypothetical protein